MTKHYKEYVKMELKIKNAGVENSVKDLTACAADKLGIAPKKFFAAALAIVAALIAAIVIIVIICSGNTPVKSATAYSKALLAGNIAEADLYSISDLHEMNKKFVKVFAESSKDEHKFERVAFIDFTERLEDGRTVEEGDFALICDDKDEVIARLKKIGDTWKCVSINFISK